MSHHSAGERRACRTAARAPNHAVRRKGPGAKGCRRLASGVTGSRQRACGAGACHACDRRPHGCVNCDAARCVPNCAVVTVSWRVTPPEVSAMVAGCRMPGPFE